MREACRLGRALPGEARGWYRDDTLAAVLGSRLTLEDWSSRVLRRNSLERRLFGWLLALLLVPSLLIVAASLFVGSRSVQWIGTLGPWDQVATSGQALIDAATPHAGTDSALDAALRQHQRELSTSVTQARRWSFIGERVIALLPAALLALGALLILFAIALSRRAARELARPIGELVTWADALAEGAPLPASGPRERREVVEVRTLRAALRDAADRIAEARTKALELERVRAWGELARRVAHEMKNPLTPLRLAVHRIARTTDDARLREPLAVIDEETGRLEELARQFAVLGRPSGGPASDVDLRELLDSLLQTDVPPHIATELHAEAGMPLLHGHYEALQRAFRNLLRNAVEAIESRPADAAPGRITARVAHVADSLVVVLRDNGCGIPADRVERIFEPDYTLKAGGTGLGLALVRQAVIAHDGHVVAHSAGQGAAFEVRLPLRRAPNLRDPEPRSSAPAGRAAAEGNPEAGEQRR